MIATLAAAASLTLAALPMAPDPALAALDKGFVCPEALADAAARRQSLYDFVGKAQAIEPDLSLIRILIYRRGVMTRHGCARTLQNLENDEAHISGGQVRDQGWASVLDQPTVKVDVSGSYLKPVTDPRSPDDTGVETYLRVFSTVPLPLGAGAGRYDEMITRLVYYCASRQVAEMEDDYFLAGQPMTRAPKTPHVVSGQLLYDREAPPADSLMSLGMDAVCGPK